MIKTRHEKSRRGFILEINEQTRINQGDNNSSMNSRLGKRKLKGGQEKPDERFGYGPIVMERYGRFIRSENRMSETQFAEMGQRLAKQQPEIAKAIDEKINKLIGLVSSVDPLELLQRAYGGFVIAQIGKKSEPESTLEDNAALWSLEYVQNIIASAPQAGQKEGISADDAYKTIHECVVEIMGSILPMYFASTTWKRRIEGVALSDDYEQLNVSAQMHWCAVRRSRYGKHDMEFLRRFLVPQSDLVQDTIGMSAVTLIDEIDKISTALTRGIFVAVETIDRIRQRVDVALEGTEKVSGEDFEKAIASSDPDKELDQALGRFVGLDLFDVQKVANLPVALLDAMSWEPDTERTFLAEGMFRGWPLRLTPNRRRPFLKLRGRYYCFDYVALMDGVYRFVQKYVCGTDQARIAIWKETQQKASEEYPLEVFTRLFKKATTYRSVHYQWPSTKSRDKNWCETDGLVICDDHLVIVESRAGSFTYTSPADDFDAHIASLRNLIGKPSEQSARFREYIESASEVVIYAREVDGSYAECGRLRKSDYRVITHCGVTLDAFTNYAARAQRLTPAGVDVNEYPFWSVSMDDLLVYADIFISPTQFAHFVEQRQKAITSTRLVLTDEIDHLGMYMEHNFYASQAEQFGENALVQWHGYSTAIDEYFYGLMSHNTDVKPLLQKGIPKRLIEILAKLDSSTLPGRLRVGSALLDFSGETRNLFDKHIEGALMAVVKDNRAKLTNFGPQLRVSCAVTRSTVLLDETESSTYAKSMLLWFKADTWNSLMLHYTSDLFIDSIRWNFFKVEDIPQADVPSLFARAEKWVNRRVETAKEQRKIGRNEGCPCGSGKKFKHCHGGPTG